MAFILITYLVSPGSSPSPNPSRSHFRHKKASPPLTFGHGSRSCLGDVLSRKVLTLFVEALVRRTLSLLEDGAEGEDEDEAAVRLRVKTR